MGRHTNKNVLIGKIESRIISSYNKKEIEIPPETETQIISMTDI